MTSDKDWKANFETEIQRAEQARQVGNEGMARVCARRAAGVVVGEYLNRQHASQLGDQDVTSAYDRLRYLSELPGGSPQVAQAAELLLRRVTMEHTLPAKADLIAEARWLRRELLGE